MKSWSEWEITRNQVAIAGRVGDAQDKPVAGVQVTLTAMPETFDARLRGAISAAGSRWQEMEERQDRVLSRHDGTYCFLDLPAGNYTLTAVAPRSNTKGQKSVVVAWDKNGNVKPAVADFRLPAA